jgi:SAM-dependent methyltransferase
MSNDYIEINKKLWNAKTGIHYESRFYNVDSLIAGQSSLNSIETDLLGSIRGKSVLHLQCHFGMDTISLARLGAQAVGVDFSDLAIEKARELASRTGTDVEFIESDIYRLEEKLDRRFDIVFTSYGAIGWLPDMDKWAGIVRKFLKPGGQFVLVEFHPVLWMFSYDFSRVEYDYFNTGAIIEETEGTYADRNAPICNQSVSWNHSLGEVFGALLKNGLTVEHFSEYDYSPYPCFDKVVEIRKNQYQIPGLEKKIPMIYAIRARKQADPPR